MSTSLTPAGPADRSGAAAVAGCGSRPRRRRRRAPARRRTTRPVSGRPRRSCSTSATCRSPTETKRALAWTTMKIYRNLVTAVIGPSGCGKSTFLRSLNRMNDSIPGFRIERPDPLPRPRRLRPRDQPRRGAAADRDGVPEAQPVPEVDLRQRRVGAAQPRDEARTSTSASSAPCAARRCGTRSRTGCKRQRAQPLRRPAAAALHRARDRDRARRAAARRAGLGARPDRDRARSRS